MRRTKWLVRKETEHRNLFQKVSFIQENLCVPSTGIVLNSGDVIITEITDTTPELPTGKIRIGEVVSLIYVSR